MLPLRPASLFRSRWLALLWAVGVCWTAVSVVGLPPAPSDGTENVGETVPANTAGLGRVQALVGALERETAKH